MKPLNSSPFNLNKMTCCYCTLIESLWGRASRTTTSPSPENFEFTKRSICYKDIPLTSSQNFDKISLFLPVWWRINQVKLMTSFFCNITFDIFIGARKNKWHFWNPDTKQTRQVCFLKGVVKIWPYLTWQLTFLMPNLKMNVTIRCSVPSNP